MLEGGQRLERGASLGLFYLNIVEARDRSAGPWGTLYTHIFSCMGYDKILSIVPCARPVLVDYLYYVVCIC